MVFESGHGEDGFFYRICSTEKPGRLLVAVLQSVGERDSGRVYGANREGGVGWFRYSPESARIKGEYELKLLRARSAARSAGVGA